MKISFAGLGKFGLPIAENLVQCGHEVYGIEVDGHNISGCKALIKKGGHHYKLDSEAPSLLEFEMLVLCLPYSDVFFKIFENKLNLLPKEIVDFSTIAPSKAIEIQKKLHLENKSYVDSPVSGSSDDAQVGDLSVFVGGNPNNLSRKSLKVIKDAGSKIIYLDKVGNGASAKLVNQFMHLNIMTIIREALRVAENLGVDKNKIVNAMLSSSASSAMLQRFGEPIIDGDFSTSFALNLAYKDLMLVKEALGGISDSNVILEYTTSLMEEAILYGFGDQNFSVICKNTIENKAFTKNETVNKFYQWKTYNGKLIIDEDSGVCISGYQSSDTSRVIQIQKSISCDSSLYIIIQKGQIATKVDTVVEERSFLISNKELSITLSPFTNIMIIETPINANQIAGEIPKHGNLKYIDGCYTSVLVPYKKGEPVLNALYMPSGIHQTMHIHPSMRCGIIIEGAAIAQNDKDYYSLTPGTIWYLPSFSNHKFRTDYEALAKVGANTLEMDNFHLVAFHPDSEDGITDRSHPMLNRTIVDGVSAKDINSIHTI